METRHVLNWLIWALLLSLVARYYLLFNLLIIQLDGCTVYCSFRSARSRMDNININMTCRCAMLTHPCYVLCTIPDLKHSVRIVHSTSVLISIKINNK